MYANSYNHGWIEIDDGYSKICHCGRRHGYPSFGPRDLAIEACIKCERGETPCVTKKPQLNKKTKREMTISPRNY
jgi:hypothetical protein